MFYTDLHIHSKYSRATSKNSNLENNFIWACKKGIDVLGTGDFTHPQWYREITEQLEPLENGLFKLKNEEEILKLVPESCRKSVHFMLTSEISTIYKDEIKCRKVHHCFHFSSFETVRIFNNKLEKIGNIKSDGRPILGINSRDLLELSMESDSKSFLIPAHIWTPWFAVLGSKSGFNSIEACYKDLSNEIFALETGLSSDPYMNWKISSLDKFRLVSNSDCHSSKNIAREATIFDNLDISFENIKNALKTGNGYFGTLEFFPEEGKYHADGCRKCNFSCSPKDTFNNFGLCPNCKGLITVGVENRVDFLADKINKNSIKPATGGEVIYQVPLEQIIAEIENCDCSTKKVQAIYEKLINTLGCEINILLNCDLTILEKNYNSKFKEAINNLRNNKVKKIAGYDGEYGKISLL